MEFWEFNMYTILLSNIQIIVKCCQLSQQYPLEHFPLIQDPVHILHFYIYVSTSQTRKLKLREVSHMPSKTVTLNPVFECQVVTLSSYYCVLINPFLQQEEFGRGQWGSVSPPVGPGRKSL